MSATISTTSSFPEGRQATSDTQELEAIEISGDAPPARHLRKTSSKASNDCMVAGCTNGLGTRYEQRYRLCSPHMKAPQFLIKGCLHRWCQKCGKFHLLSDFDGMRKSCRMSLERHNEKQKLIRVRRSEKKKAAAAATLNPTIVAATSPAANTTFNYVQPAVSSVAAAPVEMPLAPLTIPFSADSGSLSVASSAGAGPSTPTSGGSSMFMVAVACLSGGPCVEQGASAHPVCPRTWTLVTTETTQPPLFARGSAVHVEELQQHPREQEIMEIDAFACDLLLDPSVSLDAFGLEDFDPAAIAPVLDLGAPCIGPSAAPMALPAWMS